MINFISFQNQLKKINIPAFRAKQVFHGIFKEGKSSYGEMTTLPKKEMDILTNSLPILCLHKVNHIFSKDRKTEKVLFELKDGNCIESVLMQFEDGRKSVCVSTQIGCQMGCTFCATGKMKFGRNLTAEEIADQVLFFAMPIIKKGGNITNVVYMGMGEPFMNYDNVIKSVQMLNDKNALNIGVRNITISTCGVCEGIDSLADSGLQVNLAISLHAPNQELRAKIMPIARKYNLDQLMESIKKYIDKTNRRVTYEYIMLKNINDSEENAKELTGLLKGQLCHINLIPYNATGRIEISRSDKERIGTFKDIILKSHIPVTVRVSLGQDIMAACGQLANKSHL
jgi:23S rRNA (adenine2503-C2)-methyltransferase